MTYIYPDLTKAETLLYNTVIYNNLFHQKTNFGGQGTGILFYQSFRDGDHLTFRDKVTWNNAYGDVQDFIIYKNIFKSDERDRITISGRAQKAYKANQFLAHGNVYKNTTTRVNYNTAGNFGIKESTLKVIEDKLIELYTDDGFTAYAKYEKVKIPLTPAKVDYTYLKEIYDEAKEFLDDIIKNNLVGDTPGKYPTNLVKQLQDMIAEIEKLYKEGKLLQAETNTFVTDLDVLYEIVRKSKNPDVPGNGSGSEGNTGGGNGSGSGDNSGDGTGSGSEDNVDVGDENDSNSTQNENASGSDNGNTEDDTNKKPSTNEQEVIGSLPQTGEVFLRVLPVLGLLFILLAVLLWMKRTRLNDE
mgnify:FL=1